MFAGAVFGQEEVLTWMVILASTVQCLHKACAHRPGGHRSSAEQDQGRGHVGRERASVQ